MAQVSGEGDPLMHLEGICKGRRCLGRGICRGIERPGWGFQLGTQKSRWP